MKVEGFNMTHPKTDEEKVQLVKDLLKRSFEAMEIELDKQEREFEIEWMKEMEADDTSKD